VGKQKNAVVGRSHVLANPYICPVCGCAHVVLEGKWQRCFKKEFVDGVVTGVVLQDEAYIERYTAVLCDACNTRTEIEPDPVVELLAENVRLHMIVAERRGINVIKVPQERVN
jgi:hypothetical protein